MILETHKYPNGMNLHVMAFIKHEELNASPIAGCDFKVTYLKWELGVANQKMKFLLKVEWETPRFIPPSIWKFWQKGKHTKELHCLNKWIREDELVFYEFYQGDCQ